MSGFDPFKMKKTTPSFIQSVENEIAEKRANISQNSFSRESSNDIQYISTSKTTPKMAPKKDSLSSTPHRKPLFSINWSKKKFESSDDEDIKVIDNKPAPKPKKLDLVYNQIVYCPELKQHMVYCGKNSYNKCICTAFDKVSIYEIEIDSLEAKESNFIPDSFHQLNPAIMDQPLSEEQFLEMCKQYPAQDYYVIEDKRNSNFSDSD